MADRRGDPDKQPPECPERKTACPNIVNTYEGWDSETWECKVCGEFFKLYYDEMK